MSREEHERRATIQIGIMAVILIAVGTGAVLAIDAFVRSLFA